MRPALLSLVGLLALTASSAHAQGPAPVPEGPPALQINYSVELELSFARGATCPKPAYLHQEVARRLGYDPFLPDPEREPAGRLRATLGVSPSGDFATELERFNIEGTLVSTRPYHDYGPSWLACQGLMKTVAVDIADELTFMAVLAAKRAEAAKAEAAKAEAAPKPEPPPAAPAPAPPPQSSPPSPPPSSSLHPRPEVGLASFGSFGTGPHPTLGGALHVGVSITPFSDDRARLVFAGELRIDAPAAGVGGAQTQLFAGSLVACGSKDLVPGATVTLGFLGCVVGTAGVLSVSVPTGQGFLSKRAAYGALGARFGFEVRLASLVLVAPQIEILPTVGTPALLPQTQTVGVVTGTAGIATAFRF